MMVDTFNNFDKEDKEQLDELNLLRGAAALAMASKVRNNGKQVEQNIRAAKGLFNRVSEEDDVSKKLDILSTGLMALSEATLNTRKMLGGITGVALSSALLTERTNKQIRKIMKGTR
jgi:hypothetical protein